MTTGRTSPSEPRGRPQRADAQRNYHKLVAAAREVFAEDGVDRDQVAAELADELALVAEWLGLDGVAVAPRGDLSGELAAAVGLRENSTDC